MQQFSSTFTTMQGFLFLTIIANAVMGVPLLRVIGDSLKESQSSIGQGGDTTNFDLSTPMGNTQQVNTAAKRFPIRADDEAKIPTNRMAANEDRVTLSRSRREADDSGCTLTNDTPVVQAGDLDTILNATTFLGLNPDLQENITIPVNQPNACPSDNSTQWPGTTDNLKSTCPWKWIIKDLALELGPNVYPQFVREAKCLCQTCINSTFYGCSEIIQPIRVFQKTGCANGLAVITKRTVKIAVGCHCLNKTGQNMNSRATVPPNVLTTSP